MSATWVTVTFAVTAASAAVKGVLEEVVVTVQKRSESLQEVALNLLAYQGDSLTDFGITDTQALQIVTPDLVVANTGSSTQLYLRGVGTRFTYAGLDPSVAIYIDDQYISRAQASIFEFADVERIEVLQGSQGTLYARNATGGAIRVVTFDVLKDVLEALRFRGSILFIQTLLPCGAWHLHRQQYPAFIWF